MKLREYLSIQHSNADFLKLHKRFQRCLRLLDTQTSLIIEDILTRVMRVITWNKSLPNGDATKDDYDIDEYATVLDKLLAAWKKKLYDEMKAGELIKHEYQWKVALLKKLKLNGVKLWSVQPCKASNLVGSLVTGRPPPSVSVPLLEMGGAGNNFVDYGLGEADPEVRGIIDKEKECQFRSLELIASENFTSRAVMEGSGFLPY